MKHSFAGIIVTLIWLLLAVFTATAAERRTRTALVIGNAAYMTGPLRTPINDATDMADALQRLGFEVTLLRDVKLQAMEEAIAAFIVKLRQGGVGLFYFAGHGVQVAGENYIVPIDARIRRAEDVRSETVQVGRIFGGAETAANDLNVIILDASRKNLYTQTWKSRRDGLAAVETPPNGCV